MPSKRKTAASTDSAKPVSVAETSRLFASWKTLPALVLAVSGGPDSIALMWLAARWRAKLSAGPDLFAVTIDHGLRKNSGREAISVKKLADALNITHETLRWRGKKPQTGVPSAAREMRYRLLAQAARKGNALHVVTAHTRDDQAETIMMRMARGSGLAGLAGMKSETQQPGGVVILRPFLDIPKERLIATLERAGVGYADDPTNHDPRFTRPRWRTLMPALSKEGLDARSLVRLAARLDRANVALESIVAVTARAISRSGKHRGIEIDARAFATLPDEIALRLLGRAVSATGHEGPVELAKLEALFADLRRASSSKQRFLKRTLAGSAVTASSSLILIAPAPARRRKITT